MVFFGGQKGYFSGFFYVENSVFPRCYAVFETLPQNEGFGGYEKFFKALPVIFVPGKALWTKQKRPGHSRPFCYLFKAFPERTARCFC